MYKYKFQAEDRLMTIVRDEKMSRREVRKYQDIIGQIDEPDVEIIDNDIARPIVLEGLK